MRSATKPKLRPRRKVSFPPRRQAKISVNTSLIAHSLSLPPMYLRPAVTLHGSAAGVTATFVTALVSMDSMNAFHHVVGI